MIVLTELIRSCSHEKVAEAAVSSIGPGFRRLIADAAEARQMTIGAYASASVYRFSREADEHAGLVRARDDGREIHERAVIVGRLCVDGEDVRTERRSLEGLDANRQADERRA